MLAAPDSRIRTLAIAGRVMGLAIVTSGIGLGLRLASAMIEESLDLRLTGLLLGGGTIVTFGLIILAVSERLSPSRLHREITATLIGLAALLFVGNLWLTYEVIGASQGARPWNVISALAIAVPLAPLVLLALTALPSADSRLLGGSSKMGMIVALASIAGVIALGIRFISLPHVENDAWHFISFTAGPLAAGAILLLAARPHVPADIDPVPLLSRAGGFALFAAVLATGFWTSIALPIGLNVQPGNEMWLFLAGVIGPVALIVLATEVGRGTPAHPFSVLFGLTIVVSIIALALRLASAGEPTEILRFSVNSNYGTAGVVTIATGGSPGWQILGTVSLPIALATLQVMLSLWRSSMPSTQGHSKAFDDGEADEQVPSGEPEASPEVLRSWSRPGG